KEFDKWIHETLLFLVDHIQDFRRFCIFSSEEAQYYINEFNQSEFKKWNRTKLKFVKYDIEALYTSLKHEHITKFMKIDLDELEFLAPEEVNLVMDILDIILKNNYFEYKGNI